jgi:hypothetical protein
MLPDVEHLGFDYVNETTQHNRYDVIWTAIEGEQVSIAFTPMRAVPDVAGLEALLRKLCAECEIEFLSLTPS